MSEAISLILDAVVGLLVKIAFVLGAITILIFFFCFVEIIRDMSSR